MHFRTASNGGGQPWVQRYSAQFFGKFLLDNYLISFDDVASAIDCCRRMCELLKKGTPDDTPDDVITRDVAILSC
jgi:hypothetical protein